LLTRLAKEEADVWHMNKETYRWTISYAQSHNAIHIHKLNTDERIVQSRDDLKIDKVALRGWHGMRQLGGVLSELCIFYRNARSTNIQQIFPLAYARFICLESGRKRESRVKISSLTLPSILFVKCDVLPSAFNSEEKPADPLIGLSVDSIWAWLNATIDAALARWIGKRERDCGVTRRDAERNEAEFPGHEGI